MLAQVFENCDGAIAILPCRERKRRVHQIEQVMRDTFAFFDCGLCGADVEATIDLGRIAGQDFAAKFPGEPDAQGGLSRGCRPHDGHQRE